MRSRPRAEPPGSEDALAALVERHRTGDPSALNELMAAVYPSVHRFVCRLSPRGQAIQDDLVQSTLEQVCRAIGSFEGRSRVSTFVFGVCYRVVSKHRRSERIRRFFSRTEEELFTPDEQTDPGGKLERARALEEARRLLDRLDGDERAAFVLHEAEGLGVEEVAAALGCSPRTVKRRLQSARSKILEARAGAREGES